MLSLIGFITGFLVVMTLSEDSSKIMQAVIHVCFPQRNEVSGKAQERNKKTLLINNACDYPIALCL